MCSSDLGLRPRTPYACHVGLGFSNILAYPPAKFAGIVVLRLNDQAHANVERAIARLLGPLSREPLENKLWIVDERGIRIHD